MTSQHQVQFPPTDVRELRQDEVYFYLVEGDKKEKIRLHDYDRIFEIPGLYEQVVYERLKCQSPETVTEVLRKSAAQGSRELIGLRVLDLGAGNGVVGETLKREGVSRLVGADIIPEAKTATERDRPGVYDAYYVLDFTSVGEEQQRELDRWSLDALVCVAALGFGDIPVRAFLNALNTVDENGWVAFNIKESFLDHGDGSGFSRLIRELIFSEYLKLYHLERYRHRYSLEGEPLYYYAVGGRKTADVPESFLGTVGLD